MIVDMERFESLQSTPKSTRRILCKCDSCGSFRSIAMQDISRRGGAYTNCQPCTARILGKDKIGKKLSLETRKKMSRAHKGRDSYFLKGHIPWNKGLDISHPSVRRCGEATRIRMEKNPIVGSNNPNWKGGRYDEASRARFSRKYDAFRKEIMERDGYTCQISGQWGGKLVIHHLNSFSKFRDLRFCPTNVITITDKLHEEFHSIYGKQKFTEEQFWDFFDEKKGEL